MVNVSLTLWGCAAWLYIRATPHHILISTARGFLILHTCTNISESCFSFWMIQWMCLTLTLDLPHSVLGLGETSVPECSHHIAMAGGRATVKSTGLRDQDMQPPRATEQQLPSWNSSATQVSGCSHERKVGMNFSNTLQSSNALNILTVRVLGWWWLQPCRHLIGIVFQMIQLSNYFYPANHIIL